MNRILCSCTLLLALSLPGLATAVDPPRTETWNQWRGPLRTGEAGGAPWPDTLEGLETEWQVDLGKGYSGPVLSEHRVFIAETVDDDTEGARAFDRHSGTEIWRIRWQGSGSVPFFARKNGDWIRSTPAFDGESLFIGGMEERLHRIDAETGGIVWTVDFPKRFDTPVPEFGFASSPMVVGDHLYIQAANSIVKLDKVTGETLWRSLQTDEGMMDNGAFSSPVMANLAGREQLLVQSRHVLYGLEPETGVTLWEQFVPNFRGMNILTPTVWNDSIFTSSYRNKTHLFTVREDDLGRLAVEESWDHKAHGYMSSPVLIGDDVYLHLGNGRLTNIDLRSGISRWTSTPLGDYWSLVVQGGKLLALNSDGELLLLEANPDELKILSTAEVSDQATWGHLAVDDGQVVIRELEGLRVLRLTEAAPRAVPSG